MHPLHHRLVLEGRPTEDLLKMLSRLGLENGHDGSLNSIAQLMQKRFLQRQEDGIPKERWELEEFIPLLQTDIMRALIAEAAPILRERYMELFGRLELLNEILPCWESYDYALLLGGLVTRVRTRLAYLAKH